MTQTKGQCLTGYPHICKKHPEDCDIVFPKSQIEEMVRKIISEIGENYSASGCKEIIKRIAKENGVDANV